MIAFFKSLISEGEQFILIPLLSYESKQSMAEDPLLLANLSIQE